MLIDGFSGQRIMVGDIGFQVQTRGTGEPLLLLHGYPQCGYMWRHVAPALSEIFHVVVVDLKGYGDSDKPPGDPAHENYSKRTMAAELVAIMDTLGFDVFSLVGHDRGARVAHRLARDFPDRVSRVAFLDIAPTLSMYEATDQQFATAYFHWFMLIQPYPMPETLLSNNVEFFLNAALKHGTKKADCPEDTAMAEYLRCFNTPEAIHATCEDYRASATIDLEHDRRNAGTKLEMPVLALWGEHGFVGQRYDVIAEWEKVAEDVSGQAIPGGHFLLDESPDETLQALQTFLNKGV